MRFVDKSIAALKAKKERYEVWQDGGGGFGLRVTSKGVKSWIWLYRFEGKARRLTLGRYPQMMLADANVELANARKALSEGKDPGALVVAERQQERAAETVKELTEDYIERWAKRRKRNWAEDQRTFDRDVLPLWGKKKAKEIKRRDVRVLLDRVIDRGSPVQANKVLSIVRRMYNWAISEDILETNPCHGLLAPSPPTTRDRVLSADEIRLLWHGLDGAGVYISKGIKLALRLMLATAQRRGEILNCEWADIDDSTWTIPGEKVKNGKSHRVFLSPLAVSLLEEIKVFAGESKWLFPSPSTNGAITGHAVAHALRHNLSEMGLENVRAHDLRRSAASHMTGMGISRLTVSKLLNHAEGGITAVYDRHSYDAEKRTALNSWGARLSEILAGEVSRGNVVSLPQKT